MDCQLNGTHMLIDEGRAKSSGLMPRAATVCLNRSAHTGLLQSRSRSRRERLHLDAPSGALLSNAFVLH